jgi:hypothetical protein
MLFSPLPLHIALVLILVLLWKVEAAECHVIHDLQVLI